MKVKLTEEEILLRDQIEATVQEIQEEISSGVTDNVKLRNKIHSIGIVAHKLHMLLKTRGVEPKHHSYMMENRGLASDHPDFYNHFHPLEDLLKFLKNNRANDDPVDVTIDCDFTFSVYSRRWGHHDEYAIKRTSTGWEISHLTIEGHCDKGGRPFLYESFKQDSINYPASLGYYLECLWDNAAENGLSKKQVQRGLNDLANWVTKTEGATPSNKIWVGC